MIIQCYHISASNILSLISLSLGSVCLCAVRVSQLNKNLLTFFLTYLLTYDDDDDDDARVVVLVPVQR